MTGGKCSVRSCWNRIRARELCWMHYVRLMRNGDPLCKKRARGVMDAPVPQRMVREKTITIGPAQLELAKALAQGIGRKDELAERLGVTVPTVEVLVARFRRRFGYEAVKTVYGYGYEMGVLR